VNLIDVFKFQDSMVTCRIGECVNRKPLETVQKAKGYAETTNFISAQKVHADIPDITGFVMDGGRCEGYSEIIKV